MAKKIKKIITRIFSQRSLILLAVFLVLSGLLVARIFQLQIIDGEEYADNFTLMTTKTRALKSTRGNIYDVNGKLLAYNELSNSVTLEDNGTYSTTREKNLSLNGEIYTLIHLIEKNGDHMSGDFHIVVDSSGSFAFDVGEGTTLSRFRADVYGYQTIDELTEEEASATAEDIMSYLSGSERFALTNSDRPYTAEELSAHGLPNEISKEDQLKIVIVRYQLSLTAYRKYVQVTIATDVSDETVALIEENKNSLQGVDIEEDSIRVYNNAEAMAPIIGYTGKPSSDELQTLQTERDDYSSESIIGKTGIEQYMETTLQGTDGSEEVTVDNLGKVLAINEDSYVEPVQGNDVYLTIDSELQVACYQILEQRIAGILLANIQKVKYAEEAETDPNNSDAIPIPIYDVYNALIKNSVIDIGHFSEADATALEQSLYARLQEKQSSVNNWISSELTGDSPTPYAQLSGERQDYEDYIVNDYLTESAGILDTDSINEKDETYQAWKSGAISLKEFLSYAVSQNWIDVSRLAEENAYLDSTEVYQSLAYVISVGLAEEEDFSKLLYQYMLFSDVISPEEICQLLYDQNLLTKEDDAYQQFEAGTLSASDLILQKIQSLEITPKQLALDPCSGSIVIVDPDSGEVRAMVTYPGYDNNRLANDMDTEYYQELYNDLSTPFYNKATQQLTAPGSTIKPVMAAAGLTENVIDDTTEINCTGLFGEGLVDSGDQLHCSNIYGHGNLNVVGGIANSCNVFFCTVGYRLGLDENGQYVQSNALAQIQKYSAMFDLDKKTGIQLTESTPQVSDDLAIPSSIGQGTHLYTTVGLARYASTLANRGTSYSLNLLDRVTDSSGNTLEESAPEVSSELNLTDTVWDDIQTGMRNVVLVNNYFPDFPVEVYGKTGTAQESANRSNHALFIGYSHYGEESDDIAFAIRIANGYSSTNAVQVAKDMLTYYYNLEDETEVLTGTSSQEGITNTVTD